MYIIAFVVLIAFLLIIVSIRNARLGKGRKVQAQFIHPETRKAVCVGHGNSIGSAVIDGFSKLYNGLSITSREDTITSRLDAMKRMLQENRSRMTKHDIEQCEYYIRHTEITLHAKQAEEERKQNELRERKRAERLRAEERKREKEAAMSEHRRFTTQQRRLLTDSMRYDVLRRDGFRCQICGASAKDGIKLHVDHIFPVSKGGKTEMSNLRTLCERCNKGKSDKIETPIEKNATDQKAEDLYRALLRRFAAEHIEYVDKTPSGGNLYFFDERTANDLADKGYKPYFAKNGTKSTEHRPAWYIKIQ